MDLREHITKEQLQTGIELIKSGHLFYQPFILDDNLEIGEGRNFCLAYKDVTHVYDYNVWAEGFDFGDRKLADNKDYFTQCNAEYRALYYYIADKIKQLSGKSFKDLSFAEIGCNTGLMLFELAKRGAKHCVGYDWNDMHPVFNWLNDILKTKTQFVQGTWDNLYHQFTTCDIPETDIMINTIYSNHQFDPLQFLAYICDRSRVGVFLWVLISGSTRCVVEYPEHPPHQLLENQRPFPLNINNDVSISRKALYSSLTKLGFGEIVELNPHEAVPIEGLGNLVAGFRMFYAKRTSDVKSAYWERKMPNQMKTEEIVRSKKWYNKILGR